MNVALPIPDCRVKGPSTFLLQDLAGKRQSLPVDGQVLKKYFPEKMIPYVHCIL